MVYPFRRAAARFIDYLLWGMLAVAVLGERTGDVRSPSWLFTLLSGDTFLLKPF